MLHVKRPLGRDVGKFAFENYRVDYLLIEFVSFLVRIVLFL